MDEAPSDPQKEGWWVRCCLSAREDCPFCPWDPRPTIQLFSRCFLPSGCGGCRRGTTCALPAGWTAKEWATRLPSPPQTVAPATLASWTTGEESTWAKPGTSSATGRKVRGFFAASLCAQGSSNPDSGSVGWQQAASWHCETLCLFLAWKKIIIHCLQVVFQAQSSLKPPREGRLPDVPVCVCTFQRWTAPAGQATWGTAPPAAGTCCKCWRPSQRWQTSCRYGPQPARRSVGWAERSPLCHRAVSQCLPHNKVQHCTCKARWRGLNPHHQNQT